MVVIVRGDQIPHLVVFGTSLKFNSSLFNIELLTNKPLAITAIIKIPAITCRSHSPASCVEIIYIERRVVVYIVVSLPSIVVNIVRDIPVHVKLIQLRLPCGILFRLFASFSESSGRLWTRTENGPRNETDVSDESQLPDTMGGGKNHCHCSQSVDFLDRLFWVSIMRICRQVSLYSYKCQNDSLGFIILF